MLQYCTIWGLWCTIRLWKMKNSAWLHVYVMFHLSKAASGKHQPCFLSSPFFNSYAYALILLIWAQETNIAKRKKSPSWISELTMTKFTWLFYPGTDTKCALRLREIKWLRKSTALASSGCLTHQPRPKTSALAVTTRAETTSPARFTTGLNHIDLLQCSANAPDRKPFFHHSGKEL